MLATMVGRIPLLTSGCTAGLTLSEPRFRVLSGTKGGALQLTVSGLHDKRMDADAVNRAGHVRR